MMKQLVHDDAIGQVSYYFTGFPLISQHQTRSYDYFFLPLREVCIFRTLR